MKHLEQSRAAHALQQVRDRQLQRRDLEKLPTLILNNGLLATAAFVADEKRIAMREAMNAVADHLKERGLLETEERTANGLIEDLSARVTAAPLQRATAEALAYLAYLKRFASAETEDD